MTPQLNELETLLAASRFLRDQLEAEAADLLLGCRVRFAAAPLHTADEFEHVVATLYAPTSVLERLDADEDVRARLRHALDAVQAASVCVDGVETLPASELVPLAQRLHLRGVPAGPPLLDHAA